MKSTRRISATGSTLRKNAGSPELKILLLLLFAGLLGGCGTPFTFEPTFEPNEMGAQQQCAGTSANLAQYNACMEQVDSFWREYERHREQPDADDG